jgi:hypothetical protein
MNFVRCFFFASSFFISSHVSVLNVHLFLSMYMIDMVIVCFYLFIKKKRTRIRQWIEHALVFVLASILSLTMHCSVAAMSSSRSQSILTCTKQNERDRDDVDTSRSWSEKIDRGRWLWNERTNTLVYNKY